MDQRESTRKLTNTPLSKGGDQSAASPSAPIVGANLRQETKRYASWKTFKTIEDWKKEFDKHPEWAGRSTKVMGEDTESGASAFYQAFRKFCRTESNGESATYQKLFESIFPKKQRDWSALTTIGDWKKEFDSHPEWAGRSTVAMWKDKDSTASGFYTAFGKSKRNITPRGRLRSTLKSRRGRSRFATNTR